MVLCAAVMLLLAIVVCVLDDQLDKRDEMKAELRETRAGADEAKAMALSALRTAAQVAQGTSNTANESGARPKVGFKYAVQNT